MENLLQPRHLFDEHHQSQLEFLATPPEGEQAEHARLLRLGNASYRYQQQATWQIAEADYFDWPECLPANIAVWSSRKASSKAKVS